MTIKGKTVLRSTTGGVVKLTDKEIDKMSGYHENATRKYIPNEKKTHQ